MSGPAGKNTTDPANRLSVEPAALIVELTVEASADAGSSIGLTVTAGVGEIRKLRMIS
jgi:hypothetical protein